jgi:hypothetical protein
MLSVHPLSTTPKEAPMAIIILLNVIVAALVVVGILTLLGWGIAAARRSVGTLTPLTRRQRVARRTRRRRAARSPRTVLRPRRSFS